MDSRGVGAELTENQETMLRRIDTDIRAMAEPRRAGALRTKEHFARGNALGGKGLAGDSLKVLTDRDKTGHSGRFHERQEVIDALEMMGLVDEHLTPGEQERKNCGYKLTSLAEALLPILDHEGLSSTFVWFVLWANLSSAWLGAMAWNMLSNRGATLSLLVEPLCSYLCGGDRLDSQDRGAASSLEDLFRDTPWSALGIGVAPAHGRRLWTRTKPKELDSMLLLYCLYKSADVAGTLAMDGEQLANLPYGPCVTLGVDGPTAVRQLLALWLPGLLIQRRDGDRVVFSAQPAKEPVDVVVEYARRRGYQ
jgi:hypothetical protein